VSKPPLVLIRLQWWREAVEGAHGRHEVAEPSQHRCTQASGPLLAAGGHPIGKWTDARGGRRRAFGRAASVHRLAHELLMLLRPIRLPRPAIAAVLPGFWRGAISDVRRRFRYTAGSAIGWP
jgi:hypothetical protein